MTSSQTLWSSFNTTAELSQALSVSSFKKIDGALMTQYGWPRVAVCFHYLCFHPHFFTSLLLLSWERQSGKGKMGAQIEGNGLKRKRCSQQSKIWTWTAQPMTFIHFTSVISPDRPDTTHKGNHWHRRYTPDAVMC